MNHFVDFFLIFLFVFGSVLYLWGILPLGPSPWVSSLSGYGSPAVTVISHSHNFCAVFTPAHLIGWTNFRSGAFYNLTFQVI